MNKAFALAVVLVAATSGAAFAQVLFDSPGPGYRQQRDRQNQIRVPTDVGTLRTTGAGGVALRIWTAEKHDPAAPKLQSVAQFAPADEGAAEKIRRALTNAGIPFLVTEGAAAIVNVDPSRAAEAKVLLRKLAAEGHSSVKTLTAAGDRMILDAPE